MKHRQLNRAHGNIALLLLILLAGKLSAQNEKAILLQFHPVFKDVTLVLNKPYYSESNADTLQVEVLRFYISGIELLQDGNTVWKEQNSFHLVDAAADKSLIIKLNVPQGIIYQQLKFNLGIDSTTNVSGAMGGDLDPTKGMYWTWQSGYINFKLEGKSNRCKTRNNEFTFHLGGYRHPFNTLQTVVLDTKGSETIHLVLDAASLTSEIDLAKRNHIMSPNEEALLLSEKLPKAFSIQ